MIEAKDLAARRSGGHVAFIWYLHQFDGSRQGRQFRHYGSDRCAHVLVDDYAEVCGSTGRSRARAVYPVPRPSRVSNMPKPRRSRQSRQSGGQIPDRGVRHQRSDFGRRPRTPSGSAKPASNSISKRAFFPLPSRRGQGEGSLFLLPLRQALARRRDELLHIHPFQHGALIGPERAHRIHVIHTSESTRTACG